MALHKVQNLFITPHHAHRTAAIEKNSQRSLSFVLNVRDHKRSRPEGGVLKLPFLSYIFISIENSMWSWLLKLPPEPPTHPPPPGIHHPGVVSGL